MPSRGSASPRDLALYVRELRRSLRNNSGAYGYSVLITSTMAMLSSLHEPPDAGQIVLFFLGAVVSFAIIEAVATHGFTRSLGDEENTDVIALGASLNLVSIATGVGVAAACGVVLPVTLGWLVGPFLASVTYLGAGAVEMTVARRIEEARNVE